MSSLIKLLTIFITICFISGCAAGAEEQSTPDYQSTKQMMVDMLKTDQGKMAVQEILSDQEIKQEILMDQAFVKQTVQQTLTSEKGKEFWKEVMQDPEFAKTFAETMQQENEKLLKNLMKDPEYQEMMMTILKDPEMEKAVLDLMKTKEYRQQVMTVMTEAFESPYFKAKVNEVLAKVAEEQMKKEDAKKEEEKKAEGS